MKCNQKCKFTRPPLFTRERVWAHLVKSEIVNREKLAKNTQKRSNNKGIDCWSAFLQIKSYLQPFWPRLANERTKKLQNISEFFEKS